MPSLNISNRISYKIALSALYIGVCVYTIFWGVQFSSGRHDHGTIFQILYVFVLQY